MESNAELSSKKDGTNEREVEIKKNHYNPMKLTEIWWVCSLHSKYGNNRTDGNFFSFIQDLKKGKICSYLSFRNEGVNFGLIIIFSHFRIAFLPFNTLTLSIFLFNYRRDCVYLLQGSASDQISGSGSRIASPHYIHFSANFLLIFSDFVTFVL